MNLEQTIRDQIIAESADLGGRLDQLVRAGLMPANILPVLHRAIAKVQGGMSLQGAERDAMSMFINSMMFIVLGDDTVFNKARAGAKNYATEETEVEEAVGDYTVKTVSPADAWKKHTEPKKSKSKVPVDPKTGKTLYQKVTSEEVEQVDEIAPVVAAVGGAIARSLATRAAARAGAGVVGRRVAAAAGEQIGSSIGSALVKKFSGSKTNEETEELDETAKIVAHLQKRYGDNIRKSHVVSAAKDFGVDSSKLAKAVRKKLGKSMLDEEEQIDEISKKTLASYSDKAVRQTYGNQPHGKDALRKRTNREQGVKAAYNKFFGYKTKVPATEETQIDELSRSTLSRYQTASKEEGRKNRLSPSGASSKVTKRTQGADLAMRKSLSAVTGKKLAKVPATNEEVENIEELSKATMGRYINKAAERMSTQGTIAGMKIKDNENTKRQFKSIDKRQKGIATAVKKLTKEEVDQIDELSKDTLKSYLDKKKVPSGTVVANTNDKDSMRKYTNRVVGGVRASRKLTKESRKTDAMADIAAIKQMNESYKTTFDAALETYGIKSPLELDEEKRKEFFNFVDQNYKKGDK